MNGCTIPYTPIAVDFWKVRQCQRVRMFFLSHAHLDQSCGITSSWSLPIYCSPISKTLLLQRFQLNEDIVHSLELNVQHVIPLTSKEDVTMTVTLIDANHCPGSVMFLFEGYFGRILYTGDFRYTESMMTMSPFANIISKPIDVLYMDNTYCSPKCTFPPRDVAEKEILSIIEQHPKEKIVIGLRNLGKEDLLIAIALRFGLTIKVAEERYKTLELLNASDQFTVTDNDCRIEVVPMMQITRQNLDAWNTERPTIAILPTALFTALGYLPFHGQRDTIVVPYSDHSSYLELHKFVAVVKPKSIIPIVKADVRDPLTAALLDRTSVECFLDYLDKTSMTNYHIPPAVLELMNQKVSRGGSNRKVTAARKLEKHVKVPKASAKSKAYKMSNDTESDCIVAIDPSESTAKDSLDANGSKAASPKCCNVEEHGLRISANHQQGNEESLHAVKSNSFGTKLVKCSSSDRLHSLNFKPHTKLKAAQVSSPNLRMPLKRKANFDLKRVYMGLNSNLVRTRRMRLCNVHLCRTLCHSSKDCDSLACSDCDGQLEPREQILEMNRGEETMYYFTDDILNQFRSARMKRKSFDANSDVQVSRASSCSSSLDLSLRDSQKDGERALMSDSRSANDDVIPTFFHHHSPITHDIMNTCNNSLSQFTCSPEIDETSPVAIDLSSNRLVPSSFLPHCLVMTDNTPQVCIASDLQQTYSRGGHHRGNHSSDFVSSPVERETRSEPNYLCGLNLSSSSRDLCLAIPTVTMTHSDATLQFHSTRSQLVDSFSNSWQSPLLSSQSSIFSHVFSNKNSSDVVAKTKASHFPDGTLTNGQRLEHCASPHLTDTPEDLTQRPVYNHAAKLVSLSSAAGDNQFQAIQKEVRADGVIFKNGIAFGAQHLELPSIGRDDSEETVSGYDSISNPTDNTNSMDSCELSESKRFKDDLSKKSSASNIMALHSTNLIPENKLPPKKNWRSRFRMAQLHKSHQENKWMKLEPNVVSKVLVSNGTAGNSCNL